MDPLASRWTYAALGTFLAGDAVASAIPVPYVATMMDTMGVPQRIRWLIPLAKVAAALGLLSVFRYPVMARLTTALLAAYFAVALGIHARVRNRSAKTIPPALLLMVFTAMTVRGPMRAPDRGIVV